MQPTLTTAARLPQTGWFRHTRRAYHERAAKQPGPSGAAWPAGVLTAPPVLTSPVPVGENGLRLTAPGKAQKHFIHTSMNLQYATQGGRCYGTHISQQQDTTSVTGVRHNQTVRRALLASKPR